MREGKIQAIFGPMFSGKSTELLRKITRHKIANKRCLVINYILDNRYSTEEVAATHDKRFISAKKLKTLSELTDEGALEYDVIGIDEGQFFGDLVETCDRWADLGITVIVAALDCTFEKKNFGNVPMLLAISENVKKLSAICKICNAKASFTKRLTQSKEINLVGGSETYMPVCRECYNGKKNVLSVDTMTDINCE